jgi:hypothetical protein
VLAGTLGYLWDTTHQRAITYQVVNLQKIAALALLALLAAGCGGAATSGSKVAAKSTAPKAAQSLAAPRMSASTSTPSTAARVRRHRSSRSRSAATMPANDPPQPAPSQRPSGSSGCSTSAAQGECGPYADASITGTTTNTSVGNDVWNPISGWQQTLNVTNPSNWSVTASMPAGNTAVVSYPSLGAWFNLSGTSSPTPLTDYSSIMSSFNEDMNATNATSAWAAYDIWLGPDGGTSAGHEIMIQTDFANQGACTHVATATFDGQHWGLCQNGSEQVWQLLNRSSTGTSNESAGTVDILSMLTWMQAHGYEPQNLGLSLIGYGWEICSTGGRNETFQLSNFSITATK